MRHRSDPLACRRRRSRAIGVGPSQARRLVAVVLLAGSTIGVTSSLTFESPILATAGIEPPAQALATAFAAATATGSFHYVNHQTLGINGTLVRQTESGDVTNHLEVQFITGRLGDSEAIVIGATAYLKGDATALQVDLLYPLSRAERYANRWISFTTRDTPFQTIKNLVLSNTLFANPTRAPLDSLPLQSRSLTYAKTPRNGPDSSVTSTIDDVVSSTDSSFVGHAAAYFTDTSPPLPYRLTDSTSGTEAGAPFSEQDSATFSKWHEHVSVAMPSGALRYSALPPPDAG